MQDGTAGAVALARTYVDQPVLIIFVDTIFDADLSVIKTIDADGIIWVKEVEDYQRFGVVVTDEHGNMTKIVEKPTTPISKRANIGLYYIKNWKLLYEGIDHVLKQPKNKGEYYLTDAFQYMIDKGAKIKVIDVEGWYDAGKLDTLLETNRVMLEKGHARRPTRRRRRRRSSIRCTSRTTSCSRRADRPERVDRTGSVIEKSELNDTLVGSNTKIVGSTLQNSLIGDSAVIEGVRGELTLSDHSEVRADNRGRIQGWDPGSDPRVGLYLGSNSWIRPWIRPLDPTRFLRKTSYGERRGRRHRSAHEQRDTTSRPAAAPPGGVLVNDVHSRLNRPLSTAWSPSIRADARNAILEAGTAS